MKQYILLETEKIGEFSTKEEAESEMDNLSLWYPEKDYKIKEVVL